MQQAKYRRDENQGGYSGKQQAPDYGPPQGRILFASIAEAE